MTNVDAVTAKQPRKISRKDNQRSNQSFGAFIFNLAKKGNESENGCIEALVKHESALATLATLYTAAIDSGDAIRGTMLDYWYQSAEGARFKKQWDAMPKGKGKRNDEQSANHGALKKLQTKVSNQLSRATEAYLSKEILEKQERKVIIQALSNTGAYAVYVRAEKKLNEQLNTSFNATALLAVRKVAKQFTDRTPTAAVLALTSKVKGKKGKANKDKGNADEPIAAAHVGKEARRLSDAFVRYEDAGFSKPARETFGLLWAQLDAWLGDVQKQEARDAFNALAAKPEPKAKKAKKAA